MPIKKTLNVTTMVNIISLPYTRRSNCISTMNPKKAATTIAEINPRKKLPVADTYCIGHIRPKRVINHLFHIDNAH